MSMAELIGRNIQKLMDENLVTAIDIAKVVGVTRQTFSKYLSGESIIDSEKLAILANYFDRSLEYFLEEEHNNLNFMFRATNPDENVDNELRLEIENYMNDFFELFSLSGEQLVYIPEQYNLSVKYNNRDFQLDDTELDYSLFKYKLPKEFDEVIEQIALGQRKKLGAEDNIGVELVRALEEAGIKILYKAIDNDKLFGISAFHPRKGCFILINDSKDIPEERKLFTIAHEYGHLMLHRQFYCNMKCNANTRDNDKIKKNKKSIYEAMADAFAGYFLMPRTLVKKYEKYFNKHTLSLSELIFVKKEFQVSLMSLVMTLHKYEYINDLAKRKIFEILYQKGFGKEEPNPCKDLLLKMNEKYEFMIRSLYLKDLISISKVAELLNMTVVAARQEARKWGSYEEEIQLTV